MAASASRHSFPTVPAFARLSLLLLVVTGLLSAVGSSAQAPASAAGALRIVTLGDSITRGVRPGVAAAETFSHLLGEELRKRGHSVEVVNVGIGGERTDQALARLEPAVLALQPRLVTVMYGTNDSYVDPGRTESRISLAAYRENLVALLTRLRERGIEPVLMTEPRWAEDANRNGMGENPNVRLEPFVAAARQVSADLRVPLVDHYARWTEAMRTGTNLREWTTDGCHPNPRGHRELAATLLPAVLGALAPARVTPVPFEIRLDTVLEHDDGKFLWYHPRATGVPSADRKSAPSVVMTLQKHLHTSDHYSGMSVLRTRDHGKTWTGPEPRPELDWQDGGPGVSVAVADVTPGYHAPSGKVLAIGAQVRYSKTGQQLEDQPRSNQTAYAVFDPKSDAWTRWQRVEMPDLPQFNYARSACSQWLVQPDGTLLVPFYIGPNAREPFRVIVAQFSFDGAALKYLRHGTELSLNVARGIYEPSLIRFGGRYYLTLRNDLKGYVTRSTDGLSYEPIRPWTFDDGADLGSYNTQQHWLAHTDGLFLIYTRRGANNDHIIRHRAPLFIAQVNPERMQVVRSTERVLIPERGGEFGNFGPSAISDRESWVTVGEGVWSEDARKRGARGALYVAKVVWGKPNRLAGHIEVKASTTAALSRPAAAADDDRFSCAAGQFWQGAPGPTSWSWQARFDPPRPVGAILQVQGDHATTLRNAPRRYVWQWSEDGRHWRNLEETRVERERRAYRIHRLKRPILARYLRLSILETSGSAPSLREVEFYDWPDAQIPFPEWGAIVSSGTRYEPLLGGEFADLARSTESGATLQFQHLWVGDFDPEFVEVEPRPLCAFMSGSFKDWCEVEREPWRGTEQLLKRPRLPVWASCGGAQALAILAETGTARPWDCPHCRDPKQPRLPIYTHIGHTAPRPCGDYSACRFERGPTRVRRALADPAFDGLPEEFATMESHCGQIAWAPKGWDLLAVGGEGAQTRTQCIRLRGHPVYAAQFHIEMNGTPESSRKLMMNFLRLARNYRSKSTTVAAR